MDRWTAVGIGLDKSVVRLSRTTSSWVRLGAQMRDEVASVLNPVVAPAATVEPIGSSSVHGCIAKPVIDLAVGLTSMRCLEPAIAALEDVGWSHRGDAGSAGGHVLVFATREPSYRVAHLHVVELTDPQWSNYLRFRDLLRSDTDARARYGTVKTRLAAQHADDRVAYTEGKTAIVAELLSKA